MFNVLIVFFLFSFSTSTIIDTNKIDNRYDTLARELLCFADLEATKVVVCKTGCAQKSIVSKYTVNGKASIDFHFRLGCDSLTFDNTLKQFECNRNVTDGSEYTLDYMIEGNDSRDNPHLWIRKTCCFYPKCNVPSLQGKRFWFQKENGIFTVMMERFKGSRTMLFMVVSILMVGLSVYGLFVYIWGWLKSKKSAEEGQKNRELEVDLIVDSDFDPMSIIDTKLQVSGLLTIRETACLLSRLPDLDLAKYSKSKSMSSSEESTRDTKTNVVNAMPVVSQSEVGIDGKKIRKVFIRAPLKTQASGWGHCLWNTIRTINSPYDLLYRMIEHGPYQYPFTALELLSLFEETSFKMADEPSLLQIDADITVIGDLRGRYVDLHRWLQLTGWPPQNRIIFLGGILDNQEPGSLECLALICSLKCRFPKHVYILRGEPETSPFRMSPRLHPVITRAVQSCIKRMCSQMSFAAIIGKSVLCVYSGFSPMIREKAHIQQLFRPVTAENLSAVERHIIYNQPSNRVRMYRPNPQSEGDWFGKQAVKRACKAMRCNVMIRGQSCAPNGFLPCWNNRLINLWSAPGLGTNTGAVLSISKDLVITPILMEQQKI